MSHSGPQPLVSISQKNKKQKPGYWSQILFLKNKTNQKTEASKLRWKRGKENGPNTHPENHLGGLLPHCVGITELSASDYEYLQNDLKWQEFPTEQKYKSMRGERSPKRLLLCLVSKELHALLFVLPIPPTFLPTPSALMITTENKADPPGPAVDVASTTSEPQILRSAPGTPGTSTSDKDMGTT